MSAQSFPGPIYAVSLDDKEILADVEWAHVRLLYVTEGAVKTVALFSRESLAVAWLRENAPTNTVFRPFPLATKAEVLRFLESLSENGETRVCFDPAGRAGSYVDIPDLVKIVEGLA